MKELQLIKFFENFDKSDPYHRAAIAELEERLPDSLFTRKNSWFRVWSQSGKRTG